LAIPVIPKQAEEKIFYAKLDQAAIMIAAENGDSREQTDSLRLMPVCSPEPMQDIGRAVSNPITAAFNGNMANLEKITELPYALYVFGEVQPKPRLNTKEGDHPPVVNESGRTFRTSPSDYLRLSETVKMACVLHNLYYGGTGLFEQEVPWYGAYVRYAVKNGIIAEDDFADYNDFATRAEAAYIFSNCVPPAEFPVINDIPVLPDVGENSKFAGGIYLLYAAGVLTESSGSGRFYPDSLMTRSEAASIIGRIARPADRKHIKGKH
jgi:hypothetical protein